MNHIHCLICSSDFEYDEKLVDKPKYYICSDCVNSFPGEYINYRIQCFKNGLHKTEFDNLEERLVLGNKQKRSVFDNDQYVFR